MKLYWDAFKRGFFKPFVREEVIFFVGVGFGAVMMKIFDRI